MSNESNEYFEKVAETIEYDSFKAEIVDGNFIITPADAGIALLGYINISEQQLNEGREELDKAYSEMESLRDDNAKLRDFLDRVYGVLMESGHVALADELMDTVYPVSYSQEEIDKARMDMEVDGE